MRRPSTLHANGLATTGDPLRADGQAVDGVIANGAPTSSSSAMAPATPSTSLPDDTPHPSPTSMRGAGPPSRRHTATTDEGLAADANGPTPEDSAEGWEDRDEGRIGVKRACNECRQQKVRRVACFPFAVRVEVAVWLMGASFLPV